MKPQNEGSSIGDLMVCRDLNRFLDTPESINYTMGIGLEILCTLARRSESYWKSLRKEEARLFQVLFLRYQELTVEFHPRPHIILIVDDELDTLELLTITLEQEGFIVWRAFTGKEALELVHQKPDLILLDVQMSHGLSGIDVCTRLKHSDEYTSYRNIPVFFLSALASEKDRARGFQAGADAYLTKPFCIKRLVERITEAIPFDSGNPKMFI